MSYSGLSGKVISYVWNLHIFGGGYLWPITFDSVVNPLYIGLYFNTGTTGEFRGQGWYGAAKGWQPIGGTFTLSAPQ